MDAAAAEPDPAKQGELYKAAQKILVDDAPVIFLRFATTRWMAKTYVGGLQITSSDSENPGDRLPESIKILAH
jgi:ABC-type transport system substrate-binding protein